MNRMRKLIGLAALILGSLLWGGIEVLALWRSRRLERPLRRG